ncbi:unnamed protein product [Cuscuta europaea]|uniref:Zinc knuckle CX2CX4HX4C domain-containing protein n=1 Tax=Cuscuta europaea TaxID=41803 RepID=A0A9P0ZC71_CUSEU|nr:unnamed protein product [Cuscuta europaea]
MIGNFVGRFISVDEHNFSAWNPFIRIRVSLDIGKPMKRKLFLQKEEGTSFCVSFRYKKLLNFCFMCEIIGHAENFCLSNPRDSSEGGGRLFGLKLRATKGRAQGEVNKCLVPTRKDRAKRRK